MLIWRSIEMKKIILICLILIGFFSINYHGFPGPICSKSYANDKPDISIELPRGAYYADKTIYLSLKWIDYTELCDVFNKLEIFSYNRIVINLFSFGGSVFDAIAITGLFEDQKSKGKIIEIKTRGIVASAGLIIMMSGTSGYRYIDKNSFIMFHEMQSFKFFAVESVSDQEEQAKISRKIQDSVNRYITQNTKITPEKLSEMIKKKELWCDAKEAVEVYGFADKIIGE